MDITILKIIDTTAHHAPAVGTFWIATTILQRACGQVGLFAGCRGSSAGGVLSIAACAYLTHFIMKEWRLSPRLKHTVKYEDAKITVLTLSSYVVLGFGSFQTAFPSSVIRLGAYAKGVHLPGSLQMSVPASGPVATSTERAAVQRIGRLTGCHQCGDRQVLRPSKFIADHMPPTKVAKEANAKWWRRLFRFEIKQALWPQCPSCFQLQGSAVRTNTHVMIYHHMPRLRHLSYLIAVNALSYDIVDVYLEKLFVYGDNCVRDIRRAIQSLLK